MAWIGALIGAAAGYFAQDDANDNAQRNRNYHGETRQAPWEPTIQGRYDGIRNLNDQMNSRFGTPARRVWRPGDPPPPAGGNGPDNGPNGTATPETARNGGPAGYNQNIDVRHGFYNETPFDNWSDSPGGSGGGAPDDPRTSPNGPIEGNGYYEEIPATEGTGFRYGVDRPGSSPGLNLPGVSDAAQGSANTVKFQGNPNAPQLNQPRYWNPGQQVGGPVQSKGGGGGGGKAKQGQGQNRQNPYLDPYAKAAAGYEGPAGLDEYQQMARNVGQGQGPNSQAMNTLQDREMQRNAQGYESDDYRAAMERVSNYQGPDALNEYIKLRMGDLKGQPQGQSGGGGADQRQYGADGRPIATGGSFGGGYATAGPGGQQAGANIDPTLGRGEGTYDAYVKKTLEAQDPWSQRLMQQANAEYSENPQLAAMIARRQKEINDNYLQNIAPTLSYDAEASGRFGSGAYQQAQAGAVGQMAEAQAGIATEMGFSDYELFRQQQMQAMQQGSQNYNNALGIGAGLQSNRADNQTRLAIEQSQASTAGAASSAAAAAQMAGLKQQGELAREQMLLSALGQRGQADQFGMGGMMDMAQFGMSNDTARTGQLMDFASGYNQQGLAAQQMGLNAFGQSVGMQGEADRARLGAMGDAAGLENQRALGWGNIDQANLASRRQASVARSGQQAQMQQFLMGMDQQTAMANFDAQRDFAMAGFQQQGQYDLANMDAQNRMALANLGNSQQQWMAQNDANQQQALLNWQQGNADRAQQYQYDQDRFRYEDSAPLAYLGDYANILNAFGAGGGQSYTQGVGQGGPMVSPWAGAMAGAGAGLSMWGAYNQNRGTPTRGANGQG